MSNGNPDCQWEWIMQLRLLLKGPQRLTASTREITVEAGVFVIGRSEEVDWTLSDPERIVSKQHCRIERQGGGFFLTDLSTNGVLVNGVAMEREASVMLVDGDMLTLGDALISVAIDAQVPVADVGADLAASLPRTDDPFFEGPFGKSERSADAPETLMAPVATDKTARGGAAVLQDWWVSGAKDPRSEPKPVDISAGIGNGQIVHTNASVDTLGLPFAETDLVAKAKGLDIAVFARAVETALSVVSAGERHKFEAQLHELLRKERSV